MNTFNKFHMEKDFNMLTFKNGDGAKPLCYVWKI